MQWLTVPGQGQGGDGTDHPCYEGGYIFTSDHSIPNSVSLQNMTEIAKLAHQLGNIDLKMQSIWVMHYRMQIMTLSDFGDGLKSHMKKL